LGNDLWEQSRVAFAYLQGPGFCGSPMLQTESVAGTTEGSVVTMAEEAVTTVTRRLRKLLQGFGISADSSSSSLAADSNVLAGRAPAAPAPAAPKKPVGCTVFPVIIGETGSNFASATDRQWLSDFADFITARVSGGGLGHVGMLW
jgi:hypothetical protein